jgi:hypothetical protein
VKIARSRLGLGFVVPELDELNEIRVELLRLFPVHEVAGLVDPDELHAWVLGEYLEQVHCTLMRRVRRVSVPIPEILLATVYQHRQLQRAAPEPFPHAVPVRSLRGIELRVGSAEGRLPLAFLTPFRQVRHQVLRVREWRRKSIGRLERQPDRRPKTVAKFVAPPVRRAFRANRGLLTLGRSEAAAAADPGDRFHDVRMLQREVDRGRPTRRVGDQVHLVQLHRANELIKVLDITLDAEVPVFFRIGGHTLREPVYRQHAELLRQPRDVARPGIGTAQRRAQNPASVQQHDGLALAVVVVARSHAADVDELRGQAIDVTVWPNLGVRPAADDQAEKRAEWDVQSNATRCACHSVVLSRARRRARPGT